MSGRNYKRNLSLACSTWLYPVATSSVGVVLSCLFWNGHSFSASLGTENDWNGQSIYWKWVLSCSFAVEWRWGASLDQCILTHMVPLTFMCILLFHWSACFLLVHFLQTKCSGFGGCVCTPWQSSNVRSGCLWRQRLWTPVRHGKERPTQQNSGETFVPKRMPLSASYWVSKLSIKFVLFIALALMPFSDAGAESNYAGIWYLRNWNLFSRSCSSTCLQVILCSCRFTNCDEDLMLRS